MTLSVGDRIPEATLYLPSESGPQPTSTGEIFSGRKVVLVGMPGAFTPTCHRNHLPGFLEYRDEILAKGVDEIIVLATNDAFVMGAWADASGAKDGIRFVSDGNAEFVRKAGLDYENTARGMGVRSRRFAAIIDDGVVTHLGVEEGRGVDVSSVEAILSRL